MPYSNFSGLTPVTPPSATPVSVADQKAHGRIFIDLHDSLIAGYINMATSSCEDKCLRAFMPQAWRLALEQWPGRSPAVGYRESTSVAEYYKWSSIPLPKPPLVSIISFIYTDTTGATYNMTQGYGNQVGNYLLDTEPEPGCVRLPFSGIWPTTILLPGSPIKITYNCGYPAFSGTMAIDQDGACAWSSGSTFDLSLTGTWVNVQIPGGAAVSLNVLSISDAQHMQLLVPAYLDLGLPISAAAWTGNAVPMPIRSAIMFMAEHLYENREPIVVGRSQTAIEIPGTVDAMLAPYKIWKT